MYYQKMESTTSRTSKTNSRNLILHLFKFPIERECYAKRQDSSINISGW